MDLVELVVKVPKAYLDDAEDFGMLDPETIAQVLREELDERIMRFVDAEVKAHRSEQRASREINPSE
ncbi:MAG: hypothetical protein IT298_15665 [Chloroflexi bacterium]|jgi:hypothetical protein|nr:MAG: hypothetical protein UZ13_03800 [Chloroflexi bacterium OLB13]MBC6956074.1 hypothetical protein [Chloroflexota bacterium]MBV6437189.1 hypothetical protein [Anaerolineae bacterium]MDL1914884.1 hypothetical protein [Anaerolineae bacterium CFX4]MBW7879157.1 hypothetical protein [Anaerolineae bacterium]